MKGPHPFFQALKVCCPYGSWGPFCLPCTDWTTVFCNGRGDCKGNGTRVGDGECDCQWPYRGMILQLTDVQLVSGVAKITENRGQF